MIQRYVGMAGLHGDLVDSLRECYYRRSGPEQITAIKFVLDRHREKIRLLNKSGASGTETVRFISEMVDTLIRVMWDHIEMTVPNEESLVAVVAVGGYGRMELCPQSDVDLLVLTSGGPSPSELNQAETLIRNLWDYGFVLGSSVRSLSQCEAASIKDPETWTSFLNERFVAGNHELYRKFVKLMSKPLYPWRTSSLIEEKIREREARKGRLGFLVQHLEPNLKEGIGCLRDVHSLMWIAKVKHDCDTFQDLVREGLITPQELEDLRVAYDFLLQVRSCLHFLTRKKDDRLSFHIQPEVGHELGFLEENGQKPVEVFLKVFYHHTKTVNRVTEAVISRWLKPKRGKGSGEAVKIHPHFRAADGSLDLKARVGNPFLDNLSLMMEYFSIVNLTGLRISNHAFLRIKQAVSVLAATPDFNPKEYLGEFLALCGRRERVGRMLRAMNDVRLISLLIPDFNYIYCHSQHDIYHIYTTDEHTITVVRQLAYLPSQEKPELESLKRALAQVGDPEVLILACFYHDIGKGVGPRHSISGAKMVYGYMERMGFSASRCKEASNLVLYHLLMNETIQRRDLDDPKTIRDFITKVQSPAMLHKLYVLTYCDVSSVHPDAWSSWKATLLRKLYDSALMEMRSPFHAAVSSKALQDMLVENISRLVSEQDVRRHLQALPRQYASSTSPEDIIADMRLLAGLRPSRFNVRVVEKPACWEVAVVAVDDAELLQKIAGTMTHLELSILGARIFTRIDGVAVDKFLVSVPEEGKFTCGSLQKSLAEELKKNFRLSREELNALQAKFEEKASPFGRRKEPSVEAIVSFSNTVSDAFSTIDLTCKDQLGLLYQVAKVLSDLGLNIHGAVLTTEADKAMDSFYVTDICNRKIADAGFIGKITGTLRNELST